MTADRERFESALKAVAGGMRLRIGIGTLSEGTVHAVLKNYYEPYTDSQEQSVGGYIADIVGENGIIEIQTGKFGNLHDKLAVFLNAADVTLVYPVYSSKTIVTLNGETGEVMRRRKSPVHETEGKIFRELFPICDFLRSPRLRIDIIRLEADEIKTSSKALGKKPRRSGRLSVADRIPTALTEITSINSPDEWSKLIPCLFEKDFTTKNVTESSGLCYEYASAALSLFYKARILERTGKIGKNYTYRYIA